MRIINKKVIVSILCLIEICSLFLMYKSFNNKNSVLDDVILKENNEAKNKGFAIMLNDGSGNYTESDSNTFPTNMVYNEEKSGCIDIKGNKIENAITFKNNMVTLNTNTTAYCYLYFDIKLTPIRDKVIEDYTNNNGVELLSETSSDTYPVYYYTGDITNNNIIYAGFCWKMVRTTDTGGVKLIFNGAVNNGSCDNTKTATTIYSTSTIFNNISYGIIACVGYMYNKVYTYSEKYNLSSDTTEYVYGNSVSWDGSSYTLSNTTSGTWSSKYSSLSNNHYTCWSASPNCTSVYYIYYGERYKTYYITLSNGKTVEDALNEMLYNEDVNKKNSEIKTEIDSWYESNIKEKTDNNGKLYSSYLENTIYCNNRATTSLGAWNPNGGSLGSSITFNYNSLNCENKTDQFTLKESAGGTAGYGNNALDYPIGLLTYKEVDLAKNGSSTNYLNNDFSYWLMSPYYFNGSTSKVWGSNYGNLNSVGAYVGNYVRPVVSLSSMVKIKDNVGDGSVTSPYEAILP